ncbi:MAG: HMA2 domain-containing protein [Gammaproteobacteria bacterium]
MLPTARVCHAIPGRIRIRVPDRRQDHAYFLKAQEELSAFDGIDSVGVNPVTASLLIHHQTSEQAIAQFAQSQGLFRIAEPDDTDAEQESISQRAHGTLRALDQRLRRLTSGGTDFWGIVFLIMTALGINEFVKGNVAAPATSLIWYGMGALMLAQSNKDAS